MRKQGVKRQDLGQNIRKPPSTKETQGPQTAGSWEDDSGEAGLNIHPALVLFLKQLLFTITRDTMLGQMDLWSQTIDLLLP